MPVRPVQVHPSSFNSRAALGVRVAHDVVAARRQHREISRFINDPALRRRAENELLLRRGQLAGEPGVSSTRVALSRLPSGALIAAGEILVLTPPDHRAVRMLRRKGFEFVSSVGPVTRLRLEGGSGDDVRAACAALLDLGVVASANYAVAAGHIVKGMTGLAGALPTTVDPGSRPVGDARGRGVSVAVIDSGIDPAAVHSPGGWLAGIDVDVSADGNCDLLDAVPHPDGFLDEAAGHGTFVAGVVRQTAPGADVIAIKALDSDGVGTDFSVAEALIRIAESSGAPDVINLSLAYPPEAELAPAAINSALQLLGARHPDTLVIAAAGNDGSRMPVHPAANPAVLGVAAVVGTQPAAYSNRGAWIDFSCPADGVVSTYVQGRRNIAASDSAQPVVVNHDGEYAAWSGTSFAAPQIAGLLAQLIGEGRAASAAVAELRRAGTRRADLGHVVERPRRE